nr:delta-60 repeat domain-containing protein [Blastocatellia bacterium]
MKIDRIFLFAVVFGIVAAPIWAVDFKPDPAFEPGFSVYDTVADVVVQPDGKLLVAGCQTNNGPCAPYFKRLNFDGTVDSTFNAPLNPISTGGGFVASINPLPNGQYLITGNFQIGTARTNYARVNGDGSIDTTLVPGFIANHVGAMTVAPLPDGKFVMCMDRTINGENYKMAHRINSDGSPDPTFRIVFMDGFCTDLEGLPDGKLLISVRVNGTTSQPPVKPIHRLNADGSKDMTFDVDLPVGSYANGLTRMPDGKLLVLAGRDGQNNRPVKRLLPDGAVDLTIPLCSGQT